MSTRTYTPWYERLGVKLVKSIEGEEGFRYDVGIKEDETGAKWIFVAKVVPRGEFAKNMIRMPIKKAIEIGKILAELDEKKE